MPFSTEFFRKLKIPGYLGLLVCFELSPFSLPSVSPDHSSLLLHVKQFVSDLRSLSCQMAVLQGNGEVVGVAQSCLPAQPTSLQPLTTPSDSRPRL